MLREHGLLVAGAADNVVRLLPPLVIGTAHVEEALSAIDEACASLRHPPVKSVA